MKKLSLEFPSPEELKDFLAEINSSKFNPIFPAATISGEFTDDELTLAIGTYNATPVENTDSKNEDSDSGFIDLDSQTALAIGKSASNDLKNHEDQKDA
jgi:hypothetical protein